MKVIYLTAGAAGMFCGSCMHDNALARAMIKRGVDTLLVPTYTPIRTDEADISEKQVFFGGINVYLEQVFPLFRYLPMSFDRFLSSPRLIRWATARSSSINMKKLGALTVSMLRGMEGFQRKEVIRLIDWLEKDGHPDVIVLSNLLIAGFVPEWKRRMKVPVVVTLQGDDIFFESLPEPYRSQSIMALRRLVSSVDAFVVHSHDYGQRMAEILGIPDGRWHVTPLAIDTVDFAKLKSQTHGSELQEAGKCSVGYLARLAPEKGLHVLVDAFIELHQKYHMTGARLKIAGWLGPQNKDYWNAQQSRLEAANLRHAYEYCGSIDHAAKIQFLRSVDVFSVPTTYREPKGLFVLESLAAGTPVVQPDHGAFPEILNRIGGGYLTAANDSSQLAARLHELLVDRQKTRQLGQAAMEKAHTEGDIALMADRTITLLTSCLGREIT